MLPDGPVKTRVASLIGERLGLARARIDHFNSLHKPAAVLDAGNGGVQFGRAMLQRRAGAPDAEARGLGEYALTSTALRLLEQLAVTVQRNESALLVGETGTGELCVCVFFLCM